MRKNIRDEFGEVESVYKEVLYVYVKDFFWILSV